MTKKKTGFFTFIFSFIPGAGEMYMGFYKQGGSIMCASMLILIISTSLNFSLLLAALPILWFYSFFHVHNIAHLPDEVFYTLEDTYAFNLDDAATQKLFHSSKAKRFFAVFLIILGGFALWNNLMHLLYQILPSFFYATVSDLIYSIPQILLSVFIIILGLYLIKEKKQELDETPCIESKEDINN